MINPAVRENSEWDYGQDATWTIEYRIYVSNVCSELECLIMTITRPILKSTKFDAFSGIVCERSADLSGLFELRNRQRGRPARYSKLALFSLRR